MNISTRLKFIGLSSVAAIVVIGAVLLSAAQQEKQELVKNESAAAIFRGVAAVRHLTLEYLLNHDERPYAQWQLRHASLSKVLADAAQIHGKGEKEVIDDLRRNNESIRVLFAQLAVNYKESGSDPKAKAVLEELDARLIGQITNKTQAMISEAIAMSEQSRTGVRVAQLRRNAAEGGLVGIVVFLLLAMSYLMFRSVIGPLGRLRAGAAAVGAGRLDFRIGSAANDEIGALARAFDAMTEKLEDTTVSRSELVRNNEVLQSEIIVRQLAEQRINAQLEHLALLDHITRSTGERQDLKSIFGVVVRSLEDSLPIDFGCLCLYDATINALTVTSVGVKSATLAHELAMPEQSSIGIDQNGLSRCVQGQLVYEPDISLVSFPFPERLARGGLRSVVMAPLKSESRVFGVLVVARREANAFGSVECEFLRQLSEHVALAAHQAQLYESLQQAYDDLRQTQAAAMQEERLRALGQMASGIAHDINNALSPVLLYTESLLETEKGLSERARGYLTTIRRAVDDVAQTVARLREFYRQREEQIELTPVDANLMVQQVLDLTRAHWNDMAQGRGVTIRVDTELATELPRIMAVASEVREALTNLVLNAVDAMPEGGTLTLRTRLTGAAPEQSVIVEVVDSGIGMDEETRKRCLEPFFTTKGERGTGLGLAMVFGMVQRHSAAIEIDSAPGAGTTMRLVFAVPTAVIAEPGQALAAAETPQRLRLLLVDDDPVLLNSLRDALEIDGHIVVATNGGQAGIAEFRASLDRGAPYAAVITDLGMPNVDGRRVAAAVKEAAPATPVIMLTGWGQRLIAEGDIPAHVDRVLAKPPKLREVREALAHLCSHPPTGASA